MTIKMLTTLAHIRQDVKFDIEIMERELKEKKAHMTRLDTEDIPELMAELELSSFSLEDGTTIAVKEDVRTAITAANAPKALSWLVANGYGGIIKTSVGVALAKGDRERALEVFAQLQEQFPTEAEMKDSVHPMTLKSFVVERLQEGDDLPFDLFSVFPFNKITVKVPK